MDKNTLSQYGWVVIAIIVLVIMVALATPFGTYIKDSVNATTAAFKDATDLKMETISANSPINIVAPNVAMRFNSSIRANALAINPENVSALEAETPYYIYTKVLGKNGPDVNDCFPDSNGITYETESMNCGTGALVTAYDADHNKIADYYLVIPGDVNSDGAVDGFDKFSFNKYINGLEDFGTGATYMAADMNNDGKVDAEDNNLIKSFLSGTITYDEIFAMHQ